ncbi:MAG: hypothetical protein VKP62_11090 [Candidatus Sericytochromatia bacterium]|nr:hypothetical protein [Candidatus Sericytochromatia bacterium]
MNAFANLGYRSDKVQITVESPEDNPLVRFSGRIDDADPGAFMDPALEGIHLQLVALGVREVSADFTELSFLNSSGIKSLIKWIMRQTELDEEQKYRIKFVYSSRVTWQQTSLKALTYLAPKTVVTVAV